MAIERNDVNSWLAQLDDTLKTVIIGLGDKVDSVKDAVKNSSESQDTANQNTYQVAVQLTQKQKDQFDALKAQIISSADEVTQECKAYTDTTEDSITSTVEETYLAKSDFGTYETATGTTIQQLTDSVTLTASTVDDLNTDYQSYKQSNEASIALLPSSIISEVAESFIAKDELEGYTSLETYVASKTTQTATEITDEFTTRLNAVSEDIAAVQDEADAYNTETTAYIRRGELETDVYGIEIGRSDSGIKARFLNDRISFYQSGAEVAYISDNNLYILRAEILDYLKVGNSNDGYFTFDVSQNGLEVRWSE